MRGKRAKQYRKLMQQYGLTFGFREPYQVLVDAQMIKDTESFKMDLVGGLGRTLNGKVKPMITQCTIRHLYLLPTASTPTHLKESLIATAKTFERRRCNHHTLEAPLSTLECLSSVIDPKKSNANKNRYVVASQEEEVRRYCRSVKGVPLIYVKRSVMVMEPMSEGSVSVRENAEKSKFRSGIRGRVAGLGKRKREDDDTAAGAVDSAPSGRPAISSAEKQAAKKKMRGAKGPNPLSVKKPKKAEVKAKGDAEGQRAGRPEPLHEAEDGADGGSGDVSGAEPEDLSHLSKQKKKKKRRRKPKQPDETIAEVVHAQSGDSA